MRIGSQVTNPGELRTKVLLAPASVSTQTGGFMKPVPDTAHQVNAWARWTNVHGSEVWQAESVQAESPATVLIRYLSSLNATWFVSKDNGSTWYEIVSVDNIQERGEYMEIKVKKLKAG